MSSEGALDLAFIVRQIRGMVEGFSPVMLAELTQGGFGDPFHVLIATVLSHRTKDEVSLGAARRLLARYPTPTDLSNADVAEVERLIRPVGFYRVKARRSVELARILLERFGGRVPSDPEILRSLPSVGKKTLNAVLAYGFRKPALVIDTHAHRIVNRLGLVQTRNPDETESRLSQTIDPKYWFELNDLFVPFGRFICKPIRPRCEVCTLSGICAHTRSNRPR